MLTARQKAAILANSGIDVPAFPARRDARAQPQQQQFEDTRRISPADREADVEHAHAVTRWNHAVDILHAAYAAARAARSLREAGQPQRIDRPHRADPGRFSARRDHPKDGR